MEYRELLSHSPSIKAEAERVKIKDDFTGNTMLHIMLNVAERERARCKKIVQMNIGRDSMVMLTQIDSGFDPDAVA